MVHIQKCTCSLCQMSQTLSQIQSRRYSLRNYTECHHSTSPRMALGELHVPLVHVHVHVYAMYCTCTMYIQYTLYTCLGIWVAFLSPNFRCFDRFFRMVNINERRLSAWRRGFITENVDLVGLEYLWKAVLLAPDSIVYKPIELLKDVYTNLSNKLQQDQVCIFIHVSTCTCIIYMYVCMIQVHVCT